ncbi:MAG: DNA-methyltransferase [Bacteroidia bacterium]
MKATILVGDVLTRIKEIPDQTVQCVVTSPPYWGLRDYGHDGQLGLEPTPEAYVENMVAVFREIRRILKDDGVLWLNLGDSYAGSGKGRNADGTHQEGGKQGTSRGTIEGKLHKTTVENLKPKDLIGVPWRVAFALQTDGWWLRQDIIWHKPNPMPESVTDRCTKAHEYLFMLTKNNRYYFNNQAITETASNAGKTGGSFAGRQGTASYQAQSGGLGSPAKNYETRNKRSVWTINTKPFKGAHFAVMPEALCEPPILATSKENDLVFDPFTGSGTVATVALRHGRNYLGIELNPDYTQIAVDRITNDQPMLNETEIA